MKAPNDSQVLASGSHGEKAIRTMQQLILAAWTIHPCGHYRMPDAAFSKVWIFPPRLTHFLITEAIPPFMS